MLALGNPDFNGADSRLKMASKYRGSETEMVPEDASSALRGSRSSCPSFSSLKFAPLPGSGHEAEEVSKLWKSTAVHPQDKENGSVTLTGLEASEIEFKQLSPGKRVLHLATHGFFLEGTCTSILQPDDIPENVHGLSSAENPLLLSGLAFAGANHRNESDHEGIVTAGEIAVMDLRESTWLSCRHAIRVGDRSERVRAYSD